MTRTSFGWVAALFSAWGTMALACLQTSVMSPPPQQLPRDKFSTPRGPLEVHVHIPRPSLNMEIALPIGTTVIPVIRPDADPQVEFEQVIRAYEADPAAHASYDERLDYSAALVFSGRSLDAIAVLTQLEADFPGKYPTASNLGTAYELVDDLPNAQKWIGEGMKRNPESHEGTEWLHLAILNAKLQLKSDARWLEGHSVMEGERERPNPAIQKALEYQLNERLYFIRDKDPVMCDLFFEAARATQSREKRAYFLEQAVAFGSLRNRDILKLLGG